MNRQERYSAEFKKRAIRLVAEGQKDGSSQWAAMLSISAKLGCTPEALQSKLTISHDEQDIPKDLEIPHRVTWYDDRLGQSRICELDGAELAKVLCNGN